MLLTQRKALLEELLRKIRIELTSYKFFMSCPNGNGLAADALDNCKEENLFIMNI